jgi:hypothetical protein
MTLNKDEVISTFMNLLTMVNPEILKMEYRRREFESVMAQKATDAICMDFEYKHREVFYRCVNGRFVGNAALDYLEFGVAGGSSFRSWLKINSHPESRFFGFDSFEGLPEDWLEDSPKGAFSQGGRTPVVDDPRATFIRGLFQDTLHDFLLGFEPKNRMVIHMDADLYSATLYSLIQLDWCIIPGTIIMFDEFTARSFTDEFAALQDYCTACCKDYKIIAMRKDYVKIAIEVVK